MWCCCLVLVFKHRDPHTDCVSQLNRGREGGPNRTSPVRRGSATQRPRAHGETCEEPGEKLARQAEEGGRPRSCSGRTPRSRTRRLQNWETNFSCLTPHPSTPFCGPLLPAPAISTNGLRPHSALSILPATTCIQAPRVLFPGDCSSHVGLWASVLLPPHPLDKPLLGQPL